MCDIVKLIVKDHSGADFESITPEARLIEDLGMDYLDHIEFVMDLEDTFVIEIPDEEAEKIITVGDACDYVIKNLPD
ncbi:acyl carrier protein [Myxococcus xanthus DK 1622]|uniref:Acyl carrier protein n=1 Tax=Myxococcus xanthus (strain DK1622) TaxID=246197 RepID=Q1D5J9_MYXXD|nr:acyl carrier protein [Myxococcus xanthus]ABF88042.1 acyl carrier protein [Myxococcus xanthus DK 1622]UYI18451.1 acyl carrier protein [Myxococcus xanthus]UYI25880.1 acyl carrier protein [Myxococcus xanthus]